MPMDSLRSAAIALEANKEKKSVPLADGKKESGEPTMEPKKSPQVPTGPKSDVKEKKMEAKKVIVLMDKPPETQDMAQKVPIPSSAPNGQKVITSVVPAPPPVPQVAQSVAVATPLPQALPSIPATTKVVATAKATATATLPAPTNGAVPPSSLPTVGGVPGAAQRVVPPRTRTACTNCKKAKTRCSDERPCARCVKRGATNCVDAVPRRLGRKRIHHFLGAISQAELLHLKKQQFALAPQLTLPDGTRISQEAAAAAMAAAMNPGSQPIPHIVGAAVNAAEIKAAVKGTTDGKNTPAASVAAAPPTPMTVEADGKEGKRPEKRKRSKLAIDQVTATKAAAAIAAAQQALSSPHVQLPYAAQVALMAHATAGGGQAAKRLRTMTQEAMVAAAAAGKKKGNDDTMGGLKALLTACETAKGPQKGGKGSNQAAAAAQLAQAQAQLAAAAAGNSTAAAVPLHILAALNRSGYLVKAAPIVAGTGSGLKDGSAGDAKGSQVLNLPVAQPIPLPPSPQATMAVPGKSMNPERTVVGYVGPRERKRLRSACVRCKVDKVKCQAQRPCSRCTRLGIECVDAIPKRIGRRRIHNGDPNLIATRGDQALQPNLAMHLAARAAGLTHFPAITNPALLNPSVTGAGGSITAIQTQPIPLPSSVSNPTTMLASQVPLNPMPVSTPAVPMPITQSASSSSSLASTMAASALTGATASSQATSNLTSTSVATTVPVPPAASTPSPAVSVG